MVLTTQAVIICQHNAAVLLKPVDGRPASAGAALLSTDDTFIAPRCPWIDPKTNLASPCNKIAWTPNSAGVSVGGAPIVLSDATGMCFHEVGKVVTPQGVATIMNPGSTVMSG